MFDVAYHFLFGIR